MAKRSNKPTASEGNEFPHGIPQYTPVGAPEPAADVLGDFAADLGKFLGGVQTRATSWLQQRKDIAEQLTQIRDTANQYLQQLGTETSRVVEKFEKARRGRPPGSKNATTVAAPKAPGSAEAPAPGTGKRTMSEEARARIAAAQRKRWAKVRRAKG